MYLAIGIALVIVGASIMTIITAAEDSRTEGIDVSGIGWTLLVGGALTLILALIHRARRPDRERRVEHDAPPTGVESARPQDFARTRNRPLTRRTGSRRLLDEAGTTTSVTRTNDSQVGQV